MREALFAGLLLVAGGCVVAGASMVAVWLGLCTAGVLLAAWSWLVLSE